MKKNKRYIRKNRQKRSSKIRLILSSCSVIILMIISILLYYSNEYKQNQILKAYCGEFGFYGKSLTLFKDNSFNFWYHGCSQSNGYVKGTWNIQNDYLMLHPIEPDVNLGQSYRIDGRILISNQTDETGFTICNCYIDPIDSIEKEEKKTL